MRKDELLYLHQLLAVTERTLEARGVSDADAVAQPIVSPVAAHASKAEHELAVRTLAATLAASARDADEQRDRARKASS
jgi:hypothetical protein